MSSSSAVREFVQKVPVSLKRRFVYSFGVLLLSFAIIFSFLQLSTRSALGLSIICQSVFLISLLTSTVTKESLLVMRSVGLQLRTCYFLGGEKTKFIPFIDINDVIINEAITMHHVVYYLAVLVSSNEDRNKTTEVIPLFMSSQPKLKQLIEIKRGCEEVLWNPDG